MKSAGKNSKVRAIELNDIDWSHMAEPQADQYDTQITLALATTTPSPLRPEPHRCLPIASGQTICDGRVSVAHIAQTEMAPPHFPPAPLDHPNLAAAIEYLRRWPAAYEQFSTLIDTVHPCLDASIQPEFREVSVGSSSHSYEQWFGTVFLTVDNALGCAQALVHELAHQKLRALGVSFEQAWRLITNDPAVLYPSPIKLGRQRPMTAVLHAEYSFIYVTELDIRILQAEADAMIRHHVLQLLLRNVVRMEFGYATLTQHAQTDAAGATFLTAFLAWAENTIKRGYRVLNEHGYET